MTVPAAAPARSTLAISVSGLTKTYRLYASPRDRFLSVLSRRPSHRMLHVLRDVAFDVPRGGTLGIVGENGAGKSTLLRILTGITTPTSGRCDVDGRVGAILEIGAGFHPDFTGRQNIRLSAALSGLDAKEVEERTEDIIAFSELGDFIDQPVRHYSTGMGVRLGFSIAVQTDPDVLIVDEALSVGDGRFQKKCVDRISKFLARGRTMVFCSHSLYFVTSICESALWLRGGNVEAIGSAVDVTKAYQNYLDGGRAGSVDGPSRHLPTEAPGTGAGPRIASVHLMGGRPAGGTGDRHEYVQGDPWVVDVTWDAESPAQRFHVGFGVCAADGTEIFSCGSHWDGLEPRGGARHYRARLEVPELPLARGEFSLYVFLLDEAGLHIYDKKVLDRIFTAVSPGYRTGFINPPHRWVWDG
jgi:ABC-type polysaccharide/polyol phosphate transport system ATPase subunit